MEKEKGKKRTVSGLSDSCVKGVIAMVFLVIGYQAAVFVHRAAVLGIASHRDVPDTVIVYAGLTSCSDAEENSIGRRTAAHSPRVAAVRANVPVKRTENFFFDPNTVAEEDLCRLGFTQKQARSIVNYRAKGGRFRRKTDFAKSFVVSDSIYRRLEPYIRIPKIDLNLADSAAFDSLPGIGGWLASKMLSYRRALRGYSYIEQLMDIRGFDADRFNALSDLVTVSQEHIKPYPLWELPSDSLKSHPYVRNFETARAIVLYRENNPRSEWSVDGLEASGILSAHDAARLSACILLPP